MTRSKLYILLHQLSAKQRRRFLDFLASPYFNEREAIRQLVQATHENLNQRGEMPFSDERAYALVYPDKVFNQNQFRKLRSSTLELLMRFLALEDWVSHPETQLPNQLKALNQLPKAPSFDQYHRKAVKSATTETIDSLHVLYVLTKERHKQELKQGRAASKTLFEAQQTFELWTACEQIRTAYLQLNQARITGTTPQQSPFLKLATNTLKARFEELPKEALGYYLLFQCSITELAEASYRQLKTFLRQTSTADIWSHDLLYGALNFCYRRLNEGQRHFLQEIRSWYDWMLVEGILLEKGKLESAQLKNAVAIGIRLGEFEWAENLIANHGPKGLATTFCKGLIAYQQKNHPTAQRHFHQVLADPVDLFFGLDARVYLLRSYFETEDTRSLESYGNSFRVFLQRHPGLNSKRRRRYQSFVRLLRKLHETPVHKTKQLDRLRREVEAIEGFPVKAWFLKQC